MTQTAPNNTDSIPPDEGQRRIRVWFGAHPIADHIASGEQARHYEAAMRRRFASLRVTSDPVGKLIEGAESK